MLNEEMDSAWIQLKDAWEREPDGSSIMALPPDVPARLDLFFDGDGRLSGIAIERASELLHPDALRLAVPWEPFLTDEQYHRIREIARTQAAGGSFTAEEILTLATQADPTIDDQVVDDVLAMLTGHGYLRQLPESDPPRWVIVDPGAEPSSPT